MHRTPPNDMAAAIRKVAAHEAPPLMLARAGDPDGQPPQKSPLALAAEQIAKLARLRLRDSTRMTALDARLAEAERRIAELEAAGRRTEARRLILPGDSQ
jgi:hypothetical protein